MSKCMVCDKPGTLLCAKCTAFYVGRPSEPSPSMEPVEQSETVMAHRLWRWTADDGLIGPSGAPWKTSFLRAVCLSYGHQAPYGWSPPADQYRLGRSVLSPSACLCGINAWKLTEEFTLGEIPYYPGELPVLGVVELGGIVDEYERGYRAEYGQIQELTVLTGLPVDATGLEAQYDVPVRVMAFGDWRKEWELTYGRDRQTSTADQDTETGTTTGVTWTPTSPLTWGTGTKVAATLNAAASPHLTNLRLSHQQVQRILADIKNTPPPVWWKRWYWRFCDFWKDSWGLSRPLTIFLACLWLWTLGWTYVVVGVIGGKYG